MKKLTFAAALLAATVLSGVASAKQLVYCSEGSPEGFDPSLWSAGTTFDASSRTVYSRLVEFELGGTEIEPAPRRKLGDFRRRHRDHLPPASRT